MKALIRTKNRHDRLTTCLGSLLENKLISSIYVVDSSTREYSHAYRDAVKYEKVSEDTTMYGSTMKIMQQLELLEKGIVVDDDETILNLMGAEQLLDIYPFVSDSWVEPGWKHFGEQGQGLTYFSHIPAIKMRHPDLIQEALLAVDIEQRKLGLNLGEEDLIVTSANSYDTQGGLNVGGGMYSEYVQSADTVIGYNYEVVKNALKRRNVKPLVDFYTLLPDYEGVVNALKKGG